MSMMKIARSSSARTPNFHSLLCGALASPLAVAFAVAFALALATTATAAPDAEPPIGTDSALEAVTASGPGASFILAQAGNDAGRSRPLEPTFQPREPAPESWYNGSYVFALTRSVADSTIAPAGQVPLYVLTVPIDIALLPFALIGGLFG